MNITTAHAAVDDKLRSLEQQLKQQQEQQQALEQKLTGAKSEIEDTQNGLVNVAASIRSNETNLGDLGKRIDEMAVQEKDLTAKLQSDYGSISELILALERIRRIPPESLIARPGAPLQTAQSAMLLQSILPAVNARAEQAQAELDRLARLRQSLADNRDQAAKTGDKLKGNYKSLQTMLSKRKDLFQSTQSDYVDKQKAIGQMSKQAENLRDLMAKLEEQDEKDRQAESKAGAIHHRTVQAIPKAGAAGLPVSGTIMTAFGEKDDIGATSQGLKIKTRPGVLVVAPMGGIVKFAGAFRNYDQLVIIAHEGEYYSLVGGMAKTSVAVGQSIKSGEPLGNMPSGASSGDSLTLYYELRHNGKPVDPATKLKDLRS